MAERSLDKEFDVLKNDLGALKDDLANISRQLAKKGAAEVDAALTNGKAKVEAGIGAVETQVVAHPLSSLLVAFGAGILLAKLTSHR
ncbi:hypothetical protein [Dongia sp.]|uniref:hypothetical protein n=1 Tax=Dongia sp. TaxID=1977262 RepID=UPI0035B15B10